MSEEDKPKSNVVSLADHSNNTRHWTPKQMFSHELVRGHKAISITLKTVGGRYEVTPYLSQLSLQEGIVVLELAKTKLITQLGKNG